MKLPLKAPSLNELSQADIEIVFRSRHQNRTSSEIDNQYMHWDQIRHRNPPANLTVKQWWWSIKLARSVGRLELPIVDNEQKPFSIQVSDSMLRRLHYVDREAAGSILGLDINEQRSQRDAYLIRSLIEEAMSSAQLEGASTTREVAKQMLRSGRDPKDKSERMIFNNYAAIREIRSWQSEPITLERIFELHRIICDDTLGNADEAGRFRRSDEKIGVYDNRDGTLLHDPPSAEELPKRMQLLCDFANQNEAEKFIHPVVRAICLHFQIGYDHPFVDGNGRLARALFYWSMGRAGYWLTEFLAISTVLKKAPSQYTRAYQYTQTDEQDVGYFVDHQLRVIESAVEGLRTYLRGKKMEMESARNMLKRNTKLASQLNHRQRELLMHALKNPNATFTIANHQHQNTIAYQTARTDLLALAKLKLLRRHQSGKEFVFSSVPDLAKKIE